MIGTTKKNIKGKEGVRRKMAAVRPRESHVYHHKGNVK